MFYQGDLQSGILKAVQESKLVACFVTDDGEESQRWEQDFLEESDIKDALSTQTVLLRLNAGSQEAAYLAAIFPLPKTPTVVIIKNGELREYLASGVSREEFLRRTRTVLQSRGRGAVVETTPTQSSRNTAASRTTGDNSELAVSEQPPTQSPSPSATSQPPVNATPEGPSRTVQDLLAERSVRLEAHKKEQEAKEKAERAAKAKAKKEALEAAAPTGSQKSADMKYAMMQKKRQQEAREERARILKRVEDDKAERREREAQRKSQAKATEQTENEGLTTAVSSSMKPSSSTRPRECALQIRLFDGSTIRSRFSSQNRLGADVRYWIDEQQSVDVPYTFKHVLTPLPNKNISITDEEQSLQSLGLTPSATLILVPVQEYTTAYEDGTATGIVLRGVAAGYGLVSSGVGIVTGALGSFLGGGGPAPTQERHENAPSTAHPGPAINIRTLRDQDGRDDQQFYNGNALNFEPRKDDEDKKDE